MPRAVFRKNRAPSAAFLPLLPILVFATLTARAALQGSMFFPDTMGLFPEATWISPSFVKSRMTGLLSWGRLKFPPGGSTKGRRGASWWSCPRARLLKRVLIPVFSTARYQSTQGHSIVG